MRIFLLSFLRGWLLNSSARSTGSTDARKSPAHGMHSTPGSLSQKNGKQTTGCTIHTLRRAYQGPRGIRHTRSSGRASTATRGRRWCPWSRRRGVQGLISLESRRAQGKGIGMSRRRVAVQVQNELARRKRRAVMSRWTSRSLERRQLTVSSASLWKRKITIRHVSVLCAGNSRGVQVSDGPREIVYAV